MLSAYEGRLDRRSRGAGAAVAACRARAGLAGGGDACASASAISGCAASPACAAPAATLLARERFDALFITVYPVYPALLGPGLKAEFGVPFVLDYQDPWVGAWGRSVGGGPGGAPDWKSRASRRLGTWLEPKAVERRRRDRRGVAGHDRRHRRAHSRGGAGAARRHPARVRAGRFHGAAAAAAGRAAFRSRPTASCTCATSARAANRRRARCACCFAPSPARARDDPAAGTAAAAFFRHQQPVGVRPSCRVLPIARECGVAEAVTETPGRLDYLDALSRPDPARPAILLLGSSERHYTASKLYPALLAKRPILALFHEASSVVSILRAAASEPTVRVRHLRRWRNPSRTRVGEVACHLARASPPAAPTIAARRRRSIASTSVSARAAGTISWPRSSIGWRHDAPIRLTAVLTHPIQYYAPWFRHIQATRARDRADRRARDASRRPSSRASASIARSSGICR